MFLAFPHHYMARHEMHLAIIWTGGASLVHMVGLRTDLMSASERFHAEGDDPNIKQLLDRVYLDNYREPMPDFGAYVPSKVSRKRTMRTNQGRERVHKRPEGTLIAHLIEHSAAINSIAVSPDHIFFATGSEDGTIKIWDTTRLEKSVTSHSRQTIEQGGKITSVVTIDSIHCIASASDNGTIWVTRVNFQLSPGSLPKYGKVDTIRHYYVGSSSTGDFATCMLHFDTGRCSTSDAEAPMKY